jgi:inorganic pyrophosphatase
MQQIDSTLIYAVVEIPAGVLDRQGTGRSRGASTATAQAVDFLPYPGNYGFVAGCARFDSLSGETEPLPVLVLMEALKPGSSLAIRPVATLVLSTGGKPHPVVIAVPLDPELRSVHVHNFVHLITQYDGVRDILETWFLNHLGRETFDLDGWRDEQYAKRLIAEWKINK